MLLYSSNLFNFMALTKKFGKMCEIFKDIHRNKKRNKKRDMKNASSCNLDRSAAVNKTFWTASKKRFTITKNLFFNVS